MSFINIAIGVGVGAAAGGITSAINKQPVWKGMLIGAGTGAAGGALGAGLGSLGGAAAGSAGGTAGTAGGTVGGTTGGTVGGTAAPVAASTAAPVAASTAAPVTSSVATPVASTAASTATPVASTAAPVTSSVASAAPAAATPAATSATPAGFLDTIQQMGVSGLGKEAFKTAVPEVLKGGIGMFSAPSYDDSSDREQEQSLLGAIETANEVYQPLGSTGSWGYQGMARGGEIRYASKKGGSVKLRNGDFIIPADVVSAIGNGSTKAGAKYLDHLFNALTAGPAPKAGSLAKRRAQERRKV